VIEFMEHEDKPLPISNKTLGDVAVFANALAKALHYKEHEFLSGPPTKDVVEKLIGIYTQLKQRDAALGLLHSEDVAAGIDQLLWYEQLGKWDQAYEKYQEKVDQWPEDTDAVMGKMRCLHALSEWDGLGQAMDARWPTASQEEREELAPMAAAAAWVLNDWQRMEEYVVAINADNTDRSFFKAILSVEKSQFENAHSYISKARDALLVNLGPIDDYNRVYK
jgi:FKBP12-rapamycin complex-associated protein